MIEKPKVDPASTDADPQGSPPPRKRLGETGKATPLPPMQARKQNEDFFSSRPSFFRQIYDECEAMARFAFSSGLTLPPDLGAALENLRIRHVPKPPSAQDMAEKPVRRFLPPVRVLFEMHRGLTRLVAPATPRSILLLFREQHSPWRFLGPVPLVRHMMFLSILSLFAFVCLSLSGSVSVEEINKGLLQHAGLDLLVNEMFLISAAALGASFANLFEANKYCTEGSFDPKYNSSYWVRFVLGLIAGLILAEVISSELIVTENGSTGATESLLTEQPMIKPVLAMLGGFSSDLVFRILNRLVGGVESMLRGDARDQIKQNKQQAKDQANMESERQRMNLAASLNGLKGKLDGGGGAEDLGAELQDLIDQLNQGVKK